MWWAQLRFAAAEVGQSVPRSVVSTDCPRRVAPCATSCWEHKTREAIKHSRIIWVPPLPSKALLLLLALGALASALALGTLALGGVLAIALARGALAIALMQGGCFCALQRKDFDPLARALGTRALAPAPGR